jgi:hypothetical protein
MAESVSRACSSELLTILTARENSSILKSNGRPAWIRTGGAQSAPLHCSNPDLSADERRPDGSVHARNGLDSSPPTTCEVVDEAGPFRGGRAEEEGAAGGMIRITCFRGTADSAHRGRIRRHCSLMQWSPSVLPAASDRMSLSPEGTLASSNARKLKFRATRTSSKIHIQSAASHHCCRKAPTPPSGSRGASTRQLGRGGGLGSAPNV